MVMMAESVMGCIWREGGIELLESHQTTVLTTCPPACKENEILTSKPAEERLFFSLSLRNTGMLP